MRNVYKIDHNCYPNLSFPYALYVKKTNWFSVSWEFLGSFSTIEEAQAVFDKIKNMPIILGVK